MKVLTPAKIHLATKSSKSSVHQHQGGQLKLATSCYTKKVLECGYTPEFTMKPCYYQLRVEAERAAERERYERDATATTLVRTRSWLPWS